MKRRQRDFCLVGGRYWTTARIIFVSSPAILSIERRPSFRYQTWGELNDEEAEASVIAEYEARIADLPDPLPQ